MIEVKSDNEGVDVNIEGGTDKKALVRLFGELTNINNTVLKGFVKHGFSPEDVSALTSWMLLRNIVDFRTLYDLAP